MGKINIETIKDKNYTMIKCEDEDSDDIIIGYKSNDNNEFESKTFYLPIIPYGYYYKLTKDVDLEDDIVYAMDGYRTKYVNGVKVGVMSDEDLKWYEENVKEINIEEIYGK